MAMLAEALEGERLSALEYAVLAHVIDFSGLTQRSLAAAVGIDRTNIGVILDRLEAMGLIERRLSADDRRARLLYPISRGDALRRKLRPRVRSSHARILAPLAPREQETLLDLLVRVIEGNAAYARPGVGRRPRSRKRSPANPK